MEIQWSLVAFTLLAGTGAWLFIFTGLDVLRGSKNNNKVVNVSLLIAFVMLACGGLASVTHLSHPDRMLAALSHPTSGIFIEALFIGLVCAILVVFYVMKKRQMSEVSLKVVAALGILLALILSFSVGNSYIMPARPLWNSVTLPLAYVGTAAACGAALRFTLSSFFSESEEILTFDSKALCAASLVSLMTVLAYGMVCGVFAGTYVFVYATLVVVVGALAPIILSVMAMKKLTSPRCVGVVVLAATFIGACAFRVTMWLVGIGIENFFGMIL